MCDLLWYRSVVTRTSRHSSVLSALFALVLSLFVVGSMTDVVCIDEPVAQSSVDIDGGANPVDDGHDANEQFHHCNHGHCHSPGALLTGETGAPALWSDPTRLNITMGDDPGSTNLDGLIRPPRA